jgi:hypothetical protein
MYSIQAHSPDYSPAAGGSKNGLFSRFAAPAFKKNIMREVSIGVMVITGQMTRKFILLSLLSGIAISSCTKKNNVISPSSKEVITRDTFYRAPIEKFPKGPKPLSEDDDRKIVIRTTKTNGVSIIGASISLSNGSSNLNGQTDSIGRATFVIDTLTTWTIVIEHSEYITVSTQIPNGSTSEFAFHLEPR